MGTPAPPRRAADNRALDDAVTAVGTTRPHLVDAWEASAVAESLGYTSERVRRELGFADSRAFGEFVFSRLAERGAPPVPDDGVPLPRAGPLTAARAAAGTMAMYAALWAAAMVLDLVPSPLSAGPPVTLAAMLAVVTTSGILAGMHERSGLYREMEQPAFAALARTVFWRLGALAIVVIAVGGMLAGRAAGAASWPALVVWADELVLCAGLLLAGGLLMSGGVRRRRSASGFDGTKRPVSLPCLSVVLFRTLPLILSVSAVLALAFVELLGAAVFRAGTSVTPSAEHVGVLPLLAALAVVELVAPRVSARLIEATDVPAGVWSAMGAAGLKAYWQALAVVAAVYGGVALAAAVAAGGAPLVATAYLLLALAALNARVLLTLGPSWAAVGSILAGLGVSVGVEMAAGLGGWRGGWEPGLALLPGAVVAFAASFGAARALLIRPARALLRV